MAQPSLGHVTHILTQRGGVGVLLPSLGHVTLGEARWQGCPKAAPSLGHITIYSLDEVELDKKTMKYEDILQYILKDI